MEVKADKVSAISVNFLGVVGVVVVAEKTEHVDPEVPRSLSPSPLSLSLPPALIVGGVVGILFAVFLILLLVYRMKKKDEGSYDLGKKPIYKKAPTNEFYA